MRRLDLHQFQTVLALALRLAICAGVAASAQEEGEDRTMSWSLTLKAIRARFPTVAHISTDTLQSWLAEAPQRENLLLLDAREPEEYAVSHLQGRPASPLKRRGPKSAPRSASGPAYRFILFRGISFFRTHPVSNEKGIYRGLQSGRIDLRLGKRGATCLSGKRAGKGRPSL